MISQLQNTTTQTEIIYPDSDGKPMADNTIQFRWITLIKFNLDWLFAQNDQVFVAGDLLWYPVEEDNKKRQAPDVMVVFDRPKGDRGSYQQWKEDNIAPQVVFEILSPGNTQTEMIKKLLFYERYGVEEYYIYDPNKNDLTGLLRGNEGLNTIEEMNGWISPRLEIRFELLEELILYRPDGTKFFSYQEISQQLEESQKQLEQTEQQLEQTEQQLEQTEQQLEQERQKNQQMEELLRQYQERFGQIS